MANIGFSLRSAFGLIPATEKIEATNQSLQDEYEKVISYSESEELAEYIELKSFVESDEFKSTKKNTLALNFKTTDEYKKEIRFNKLTKNKKISNYFKILESKELSDFNITETSDELSEFLQIQEYLKTQDHINIINNLDNSLKAEKEKVKELKSLTKSTNIKLYFKVTNSTLFKNYTELKDSNELQEYIDLKELTESEDFINLSKESDFKESEEFQKTIEYKKISKIKKFKRYFKFLNSSQFNHYNTFKDSEDLEYYNELKAYVLSDEYPTALSGYTYKNSDEYQKEVQYGELKKSISIVNWLKYQKQKKYLLYKDTEGSELLNEFNELESFNNSDEFKELKEYMLDKDKWQKTEEFEKEMRFNELHKSETIKWYFTVKDSNKFDEIKAWNITFEDDFTVGKIEEDKWMNSYFWGQMLLNDRYVMAGDKHFYTDNKNVELNGTSVKIITKQEKANGKVWNPIYGFSTQDFNYTSGMLSTSHSFRQLYGRIEAKIKLNSEFPVYQAFWLKGEKILPEIDIFKFNMDKRNRFQMSTLWGDINESKSANRKTDKINGSSLTKDFFIYSLDWTEEKLTWKINGIEVFSTTEGIPSEPLYLMLTAGLKHEPNQEFNSAAFEIDWVRCYEKA